MEKRENFLKETPAETGKIRPAGDWKYKYRKRGLA